MPDIFLYRGEPNPKDIKLRVLTGATEITPQAGELKAVGEGVLKIAGPLILTGYAPTMDSGLTPPVGALDLTGQAASIGGGGAANTNITPAVAALVLTGSAPGLQLEIFRTPAVGALAITGAAPIAHITATPNTVALVLEGFAPTVSSPAVIAPGAATLELAASAPSIPGSESAGAGGGSAYAPSAPRPKAKAVGMAIQPSTARLAIRAQRPTPSVTNYELEALILLGIGENELEEVLLEL